MGKIRFGMTMSLDGFVADPGLFILGSGRAGRRMKA
jgi:hypothetical protein